MKQRRKKDLNILNKIVLCFGLQYKPSSGAEWKKDVWKENRYKQKLNKNTRQWLVSDK